MPFNQRQIIEQVKFAYSPLGKPFEKQRKTIEEQGEKLEEHGKQLVKSSDEKESSTHLKKKKVLKNLLIKE